MPGCENRENVIRTKSERLERNAKLYVAMRGLLGTSPVYKVPIFSFTGFWSKLLRLRWTIRKKKGGQRLKMVTIANAKIFDASVGSSEFYSSEIDL